MNESNYETGLELIDFCADHLEKIRRLWEEQTALPDCEHQAPKEAKLENNDAALAAIARLRMRLVQLEQMLFEA